MCPSTESRLEDQKQYQLVKELAEAVSTQAQVANRTWLALITAALFAVIPHASKNGDILLPFSLGEVSPPWFHGLALSFIVVLAIAFAAAHTQQVRAQKLAHSAIDSLTESVGGDVIIHPRDYFDMLRKPSLNRIASLAQALRGKHQFFSTMGNLPKWLRLITALYYAILKAVTLSIYFVLPLWALWRAHTSFAATGMLHACNVLGTLIGRGALLQVFWLDLRYAVRILKYFWTPESVNDNRHGQTAGAS